MAASALSMSSLPPIFILPTHLQTEDLHEAEDALYHAGGRLSYHATESRIFLGKVLHKKRAMFDLRSRGLWTKEEAIPHQIPTAKRRKLGQLKNNAVNPRSEARSASRDIGSRHNQLPDSYSNSSPDLSNHIVVLRIEWLEACIKQDTLLSFDDHLVYSGKIIERPLEEKRPGPIADVVTYIKAVPESDGQITDSTKPHDPAAKVGSILEHGKAEAGFSPSSSPTMLYHRRRFGQKNTSPTLGSSAQKPKLLRATTSEMENADPSKLPPIPDWMLEDHPRPMYSCLRSTFPVEDNPNKHFIAQLTKIKEARLLTLDEIGVRAYSTSIASLSAYTHRITSPSEITRLPGCNEKIASLWIEWHDSVTTSSASSPLPNEDVASTSDHDAALDPKRTIPAVRDLESDTDLSHLRTFHQIWGVGPDTARKFYLNHGWKDIDDIVEFGWSTLNRVQQIGVKFYEEFQLTIPRLEVESIARTILHHARLCKSIPKAHWTNDVTDGHNGANKSCLGDPRDFVAVLVGGYRRGKSASGDVDVILSHRDDRLTKDLVVDVVHSLESAGYITHTLTLHTTTSDRGQQTLPYRSDGGGHGFDSLDKALCVWQEPEPDRRTDSTGSPVPKNLNVHRRVDIIVSSWRTIGCAVLGWSGGTTFQRDIRRWVKREKGWKYDSSGVRDRANGLTLELEAPDDDGENGEDDGDGWEDRERRLMQRMGIGWRPAGERCTG